MMKWIRKLFGMCDHDWKYVQNVNLNQFDNTQMEDEDDEAVSSSEFSKKVCTKCKAVCFRKL